jgi:hypothetical protein
MSNLWVFGDSFTIHSEKNEKISWTYKLAKKLGVKNYYNYSQFGAANDFITSMLETYAKEIKSDDYIIVLVTYKSRIWFFEDHPELGNLNTVSDILIKKYYDKNTVKAINYYQRYLESERLCNIRLSWLYGYLQNLESYFPNLMILPAFDNGFHVDNNFEVIGSLFTIGCDEYKTHKESELIFKNKWKRFDMRSGHMSPCNHDILAEKIYNSFTNKVPLILCDDFEKHFINLENCHEFITIDPDHIIQTG